MKRIQIRQRHQWLRRQETPSCYGKTAKEMILVTRGRQTGGKFRRLRIPIRARFAKRGDELEDGGISANRFGEIWKQCRFACPKTRQDSVRRIALPGTEPLDDASKAVGRAGCSLL